MHRLLWTVWLLVTAFGTAYLVQRQRGPRPDVFLSGRTSHGHHQIELACSACHTPGMGVKEESCLRCHGAELKQANDSHPKSKFTDPRNADLLGRLDAANCVTCHREHVPEQTGPMSVSVPADYCYHCHQETVKERPSHRDYAFDSCANAGCHNYHDNSALYEDFLAKHLHEPAVRPAGAVPPRSPGRSRTPLTAADADAPGTVSAGTEVLREWAESAHARGGVNCGDCHLLKGEGSEVRTWSDKPGLAGCAPCHRGEADGFLAGRHGMRLAQNLPPMTPEQARLPMNPAASHRELDCASCHGVHRFATQAAAVDSCLGCHDDGHSRAYRGSSHFALWQDELAGRAAPGTGVSCATCHLPREADADGGTVRVQHNQNASLRPNEKMIRPVCLHCHGLGFTLDALADPALVQTNFTGRPQRRVESLDLVARRLEEAQQRKPEH